MKTTFIKPKASTILLMIIIVMAGSSCNEEVVPVATATSTFTREPSPTPTITNTPSPLATATATLLPTNTFTPTITVTSIPLTPTPTCPPDTSKYGFEVPDILWVPQTYPGSQAVTAVHPTNKVAPMFGCYSLELTVDLIGGDEQKSKGEAFVDMKTFAPTAVAIPVNLEGVSITIWALAPGDASGPVDKPNGFQVFVKDENNLSEYGSWFNLVGYTKRWIPLRLTPRRTQPQGGYMDSGFDPTRIVVIGLKFGTGDKSTATYSGPIWIDGVDW